MILSQRKEKLLLTTEKIDFPARGTDIGVGILSRCLDQLIESVYHTEAINQVNNFWFCTECTVLSTLNLQDW